MSKSLSSNLSAKSHNEIGSFWSVTSGAMTTVTLTGKHESDSMEQQNCVTRLLTSVIEDTHQNQCTLLTGFLN